MKRPKPLSKKQLIPKGATRTVQSSTLRTFVTIVMLARISTLAVVPKPNGFMKQSRLLKRKDLCAEVSTATKKLLTAKMSFKKPWTLKNFLSLIRFWLKSWMTILISTLSSSMMLKFCTSSWKKSLIFANISILLLTWITTKPFSSQCRFLMTRRLLLRVLESFLTKRSLSPSTIASQDSSLREILDLKWITFMYLAAHTSLSSNLRTSLTKLKRQTLSSSTWLTLTSSPPKWLVISRLVRFSRCSKRILLVITPILSPLMPRVSHWKKRMTNLRKERRRSHIMIHPSGPLTSTMLENRLTWWLSYPRTHRTCI